MKIKTKKKRIIALVMCLLMVATLFQGNGFKALADVIDGEGAPSGEMATVGDAEELAGEASAETSVETSNETSSEESSLMMVYEDIEAQAMTASEPELVEESIVPQGASNIGDFLKIVNAVSVKKPVNLSNVNANDDFEIKMDFSLPSETEKPLAENYIYVFNLSDIFAQKVGTEGEIRDLIKSEESSTTQPMPIMKNSEVVGYYEIESGVVTLDFSVGIPKLVGERTGDFTFGCKLNEDKIADEGGEYKLKYGTTPGQEITTVTFKPKDVLNPGVVIDKTGGTYNQTTGYFEYTIKVQNKGSAAVSNLIITDTLGKSLELVTSTVSGAILSGPTATAEGSVSTLTIDSIGVDEIKTITYSCKPTEEAIVGANNTWGNSNGVSNKISAKANNIDKPIYIDENKSKTEQTIYTSIKKDLVYKTQSSNTEAKTVTWTIVINDGETVFDLNGYKLTDAMDSGLTVIPDTVNVTGGDAITNAAIADAIKAGTDYTFGNTTNKYTITYTTNVDVPTSGQKSYKNTATLQKGSLIDKAEVTSNKFGASYSSKAYVGNTTTPPVDTTESSSTEGELILPWTSTITVPDDAAKFVYTDTIGASQYDKGLGFLESSFKIKTIPDNVAVDSSYYTVTYPTVSWSGNGDINEYQMVVTLTGAGLTALKGKTLQIDYKTIGAYKNRSKGDNNNRYSNRYQVAFSDSLIENGQASVDYPYTNDKYISKKVVGAHENNGTISWCVEVDASNAKNLTFTDTIKDMAYCGYRKGEWSSYVESDNPVAYVEFNKSSGGTDTYLVGMNVNPTAASTVEHPEYTYSIDFKNATITPVNTWSPATFVTTDAGGNTVIDGTLRIFYTTKPQGVEASYNHTGTYTNSATITYGEPSNLQSQTDTATGQAETKVLSKSSDYDTSAGYNVLAYTLDANSAGIDLTEQGNFYVVEDELPSKLIYRPDGTTVINSKTGEVLSAASSAAEVKSGATKTKYHVSYVNNVLIFTVPDGVPLKITYRTTMLADVGETNTYVNSAKIAAPYVSQESYSSDSQNRQVTYSAANITSSIFTVEKVDAEDLTKHLKDAEFKVNEYSYNTTLNDWSLDQTYTAKTGSDGKLYAYTQKSITDNTGNLAGAITNSSGDPIAFTANKIYEIRETKAPDGYAITTQYYKVILVDKTASNYEASATIPADTAKILQGTNLLFTNVPTTQDNKLILSKEYYDADGTTPAFPTVKAEIKIYDQNLTLAACQSGIYTPLSIGAQGGGFTYAENFDTASKKHTITLSAVPNGIYTVYEAAAPDGYEKLGRVYHFKVENKKICWDIDDSANTDYLYTATGTIANKKVFANKFTINKLYFCPGVDTSDNTNAMTTLLPGQDRAEFTCKSVATGVVTDMTTTDGKTFIVENLSAGEYEIAEKINDSYTVVDSLLPLKLTVLPNGSITIKDKDGNSVDATLEEMANALQERKVTVKNQLKENRLTIHKSYYDKLGNQLNTNDSGISEKAGFKLQKKVSGSWVDIVASTDYSEATGPIAASAKVDDYEWKNIVPGSYKIVETMSASEASKYEPFTEILFTVDDNYKIEITGKASAYDAETAVINRQLGDTSCRFYIAKYLSDQNGNTTLANDGDVTFKITDKNGNDVTNWIDSSGVTQTTPAAFTYNAAKKRYEVSGLQAGSYKVSETGTKSGYVKAKNITFDVKTVAGGELTVDNIKYNGAEISASNDIITSITAEDGVQTVVAKLINRPYENKITIKKSYYQPNGITLVSGQTEKAEFTLYKVSGSAETEIKKIASNSTDDNYVFSKLEPGSYVIKETKVPEGYTGCADVKFTVGDDYAINVTSTTGSTITDITYTPTDGVNYEVEVSTKNVLHNSFELTKKYTYADGTEVTDASTLNGLRTATNFVLKDSGGNDITVTSSVTWANGTLTIKDLADGTYTIEETAPTGFATIGDITLTVSKGNIQVSYAGQSVDFTNLINNGKKDVTATLYNRQESNKLEITKIYKDANGNNIAIANVATKAGFTMKNNATNTVITGSVNAATGKYSYTNLLPGNYTITESAPAGYTGVASLNVTVDVTGVINVTNSPLPTGWSTTTNNTKAVALEAVNEFKPNRISIKKRYVDDAGNEIPLAVAPTSMTAFNISNVSNTVNANMAYNTATGVYTYEKLLPGVYTIKETVPNGYENVGDITVTVAADGKISSTYGGTDMSIFSASNNGSLTGSVITFTNRRLPENSVVINKKYVSANGTTLDIATDLESSEFASFKLYHIVGGVDNEVTSAASVVPDAANGIYKFKNLAPGNYKIVETAGTGFTAAADISFVVNADHTITNLSQTALANSTATNKYVEVKNTRNSFNNELKLTKAFINQGGAEITDSAYDTLFNEVEFKMYDSSNREVTAFEKDNVNKCWKVTKLEPGIYTVKETSTPAGYVAAGDVTVTVTKIAPETSKISVTYTGNNADDCVVTGDQTNNVQLKLANYQIVSNKIVIDKKFYNAYGQEITGTSRTDYIANTSFKYHAVNSNVEIGMAYDDTEGGYVAKDLQTGTYIIEETTVDKFNPVGEIKIIVKMDGQIEVTYGGDAQDISVTYLPDNKTATIVANNFWKTASVNIGKKDFANGEELPGAKLKVTDKVTGALVDEWTSDTSVHKISISSFVANRDYILTEITAPFGYDIAEEITFRLDENGKVYVNGSITPVDANTFYMEDKYKYVTVSKKDLTLSDEILGAKLVITDKSGNTVVDSWTSSDIARRIPITSFEVNKEYVLTEITAPYGYEVAESIMFFFDNSGSIYVKNQNGMYQKLTSETLVMVDGYSYINFSKTDITNGNELPGAVITIKDANGREIDSWTSTTEKHNIKIKDFAKDSDYYFTEVTAPYGYDVAETIIFKIGENNKISIKNTDGTYTALDSSTIVMKDAPAKIKLSKTDITNGAELPGATIKITDASGNDVVTSWVSGSTPKEIDVLTFAKDTDYYFTEVTAPAGYDVAETIVFKIGENNKIYIKNTDGTYTALDTNTIVMKDKPTDTPGGTTETTTETATSDKTTTITTTSSEVKTGDTAPVRQVCILMLISVVGMLGLGILIRLNKKDEE